MKTCKKCKKQFRHQSNSVIYCSLTCAKPNTVTGNYISNEKVQRLEDGKIFWYYSTTFKISPLSDIEPPFISNEHIIPYYRYQHLIRKPVGYTIGNDEC